MVVLDRYLFLSLAFTVLIPLAQSAVSCRPFNRVYPPPRNISGDVLTSASQGFSATLAALLQNATTQSATNVTSFSARIYSTYGEEPIFTYHHTAPSLASSQEGVTEVDSNTVYRLASVSKALTIYIYLLAAGDTSFNDPVTKYVPELAAYAAKYNTSSALDVPDWDSITVGALASQLSGIARDPNLGAQTDPAFQQALGLPAPQVEIPSSDFCGPEGAALKFACNRTAFFEENLFRPPNAATYYSPVYNNMAYQIFSYAVENITGQSYEDMFQTYLVGPHGLNSTTYAQPASPNNSVIPINITSSLYDVDPIDGAVFGGYFSSLNDLTTLGRAILNSTFLTRAQTNRWFTPRAFLPPSPLSNTAGVFQAIGTPWEIVRAPAPLSPLSGEPAGENATAAATYQTWIYAKEGDFGLYSSSFTFMPEFASGLVILAAGLSTRPVVTQLEDYMTETYVPALFEASRLETAATYAGTYTDEATNSTLVLEIADATADRQGLLVQQFTYNSTDFLAAIASIYGLPAGAPLDLAMYPNGLVAHNGAQDEEGWKAVPGIITASRGTKGAFTSECVEFGGLGSLTYGGIDFNDYRFTVEGGSNGQARVATAVSVPFIQLSLTKSTQ